MVVLDRFYSYSSTTYVRGVCANDAALLYSEHVGICVSHD